MRKMMAFVAVALLLTAGSGPQAGEKQPAKSRIETEGIVEAPVGEVWKAFTTKEGMESWMVAHAEIDLKIGGTMRTHYSPKGVLGDAGTIENTVICFDPERMLSIKISKPPEKFPFKSAYQSTWTVIYFDKMDAGQTRVQVVMQGYGADEEAQKMLQFFDKGNAFTLKKLQEHFHKKKTSGS